MGSHIEWKIIFSCALLFLGLGCAHRAVRKGYESEALPRPGNLILLDLPFNNRLDAFPSMAQSLAVSREAYGLLHGGLQRATGEWKPVWGKLIIISADV